MATVLAIETSCDETAAAVVKKRHVLSSVVSSQISAHQKFGGVVPEVASRMHLEAINAVVKQAIQDAELTWAEIDGVGVTCAPGLVGALLVGISAAKTLAILHQKPLIGVHHLEGHIFASFLSVTELSPPFLCLLVSGGHTSLIQVRDYGMYQTLGQTRDDAVGEAFDKVARLLDLGYPGGPAIDKAAKLGNPKAFHFPEGNISLAGGGFHPYDSSFSGLKTASLRLVQQLNQTADPLPVEDLAASFQASVARSLTKRTIRCAVDHGLDTIVVGGGVAANSALRSHLKAAAEDKNLTVHFPPLSLCTDNAAMIAGAAAMHLENGHVSSLKLGVHSRFPLENVMTLYGDPAAS